MINHEKKKESAILPHRLMDGKILGSVCRVQLLTVVSKFSCLTASSRLIR